MQFGGSGITEQLFEWICKNVEPRSHILELGSGDVSTPYLSARYRLTSVEDDPAWVGKHPNVNYIHAPIVGNWYAVDVLMADLPSDYKLILVDGPLGGIGRGGFADNFELFLRHVPIVIDDTWREAEFKLAVRVGLLSGGIIEHFGAFSTITPTVCQQ